MPIVDHDLMRRLRMGLGLTQEDLATRVGCDCRTIQRAENGKRVGLRTARGIGEALDVDLPTIMSLDSRYDNQVGTKSEAADTANRQRKYVYIVKTQDISPFEEIAGKVEDAPNWEATGLGLHVEVYLSSEEAARVQALESVSVFDQKQHVLTEQDIAVHDELLWSKRATEAHKNPKS